MRILQINSARQLGGGETHTLELAAELRRTGHEVWVAGHGGGPLAPDIAWSARNSADLLAILRLRQILIEYSIEVAHAHNGRDYVLLAAAAWNLPQVTVILTRHLVHWLVRYPLYRRVDGWLGPTSAIVASLKRVRPHHVAVISNWVDVDRYAYQPKPFHTPIRLGLLGEISPHKGHDDALEAVRRLGAGYRLDIAGRGKRPYVDQLRRQADGLPVVFRGQVAAPQFLSEMDILLVPSWVEAFGLVVLEAMAAGVPVIATARGGPAEFARPGRDAILIEPRSPKILAEAVRELTAAPEMLHHLTTSARQRVETDFACAPLVQRVVAFYQTCRQSR